MNLRYTYTLLLAASLGCTLVSAQQQISVSQYMFNGLFMNPASAGTHDYATTSILHRTQWSSVDGSPTTSTAAIDAPFMKGKMGSGLTIINDRIGVSKDLEVAGHFAYHIRTGAHSKLSFGLRAGLSIYSAQLSDLRYWDTNDPVFQNNINNVPIGKFGFGAYWYNSVSYVGFSAPNLYSADGALSHNDSVSTRYYSKHYYLQAGKIFPLNEDFDIKPSTVIKVAKNGSIQADVNCNVLYRERIWLGVGYRTGAAFVGMAEYMISPVLRIGYAYDMAASRLRNYTTGSHEVMLGLDFGRAPITIKSPRYF